MKLKPRNYKRINRRIKRYARTIAMMNPRDTSMARNHAIPLVACVEINPPVTGADLAAWIIEQQEERHGNNRTGY